MRCGIDHAGPELELRWYWERGGAELAFRFVFCFSGLVLLDKRYIHGLLVVNQLVERLQGVCWSRY